MSLISSISEGILTLTLNRPDKRNALDTPTLDALQAALDQAELESQVRVVAIRGAGKDFCAGADLNELLASAEKSLAENEAAALRMGGLFVRIRTLPSYRRGGMGGRSPVARVHGLRSRARDRSAHLPIRRSARLRPRDGNDHVSLGRGSKGRFRPAGHRAGLTAPSTDRGPHLPLPDADFEQTVEPVLNGLAVTSANARPHQAAILRTDGVSSPRHRTRCPVNAPARAYPDFRTQFRLS
jgi:hypothetical protein